MTRVHKNNLAMFAIAAVFGFVLCAVSAKADNVPQTVGTVTIDVVKLSTGFRTSKIIGSNVVNDNNDTIGKIDDLIVSPDENKIPYVILSVGGFLGMGSHLVAVPYSLLIIGKDKILLPRATKDALKAMPEFKYSTN